jgi:hypothetical protein
LDVFGPPYSADLFGETEARTELLEIAEAFLRGLDGRHQLEERAVDGAATTIDEKTLTDHHEPEGDNLRRLDRPQDFTDVQLIVVVHGPSAEHPRERQAPYRRAPHAGKATAPLLLIVSSAHPDLKAGPPAGGGAGG